MAKQSLPKVFKVKVRYKDEAHPDQLLAVTRNEYIRTAEDAENHCLKYLHHKDDAGEIFPCVEAKAVRPEPFDVSEAPVIRSVYDKPKAPDGDAQG